MDLKRDMVMRKGGRMVMILNGEMLLMDMDVLTADGIRVQRDGTIFRPDGTRRTILEDEAMVVDVVMTRMEET